MSNTQQLIKRSVAHVIETPDASVLIAISKHGALPNVMSARFIEEMKRPWVRDLGVAVSVDRQISDQSRVRLELAVLNLNGKMHKAEVIFARVTQDHQVRGYEPSYVFYDELASPEIVQAAAQQAGRRIGGKQRAEGF